MISEIEREKIKKEAKDILDSFSKSLEKANIQKEKESKNILEGFREEKNGKEYNSDFRESMFANALEVRNNCIVAEKKKW